MKKLSVPKCGKFVQPTNVKGGPKSSRKNLLMKTSNPAVRGMAFLCTSLMILSSCSKDADLLTDYVVADNLSAVNIQTLLLNDSYTYANSGPIVLDVLSNDSFFEPETVNIIEVSEPENGTVTINEDKTITYTPNNVIEDPVSDDSVTNDETATEVENTPEINTTVDEVETVVIENTSETEVEPTPTEVPDEPEVTIVEEELPEDEAPTSDSFSYTVETTDEEGKETIQKAVVDISFEYGEVRAFPGAEGYGKYTTGGRGGKVIHVTNLNDSGSGSLREVMEKTTGARTVVFDVSGFINIDSPLKIRPGYGQITIAGQTAPKGGITIRGASVWIQDSEVIMRYVSIRPGRDWLPDGPNANTVGDYEPDDAVRLIAFSGSHIQNIIMDHCTVSWGRDGIIDITTAGSNASIKDVTIQNSILSENVDKGYGSLISGNVDNLTYYKNFIAHCSTRNIAMNLLDGDIEFINNIVYGLGRGAWVKYSCRANLIGNVYTTNPNNPRSSETIRLETNNGAEASMTEVYLMDNTDDGHEITHNSRMGEFLYNSPRNQSGIQAMPNNEVQNTILSDVGNSIDRDEVDTRVINQLKTLSGKFIKHENEVGGYPNISSITQSQNFDSDKDGMSDKWESENNFSSPYEADSQQDHNNDGFTDLEDYLHILTLSADDNV